MPASGNESIFARQAAHRIPLGFALGGEATNLLHQHTSQVLWKHHPSLSVVCVLASCALAGNYGRVVNELLEPPCWVLAAAARRGLTALDLLPQHGQACANVQGTGAARFRGQWGLTSKLGFRAQFVVQFWSFAQLETRGKWLSETCILNF